MKDMVFKVLQDEVIPIYDSGGTQTSLNIKWHWQDIRETTIGMQYTEPQQCVLNIPMWCDVYVLDTYKIVEDFVVNLNKIGP